MTQLLPVDFEIESTQISGSWHRAENSNALIEQLSWEHWLVYLGGDVHRVQLHIDSNRYVGKCINHQQQSECKGWAYHSGPCAHLCAVYQASQGLKQTDTRGRDVIIHDRDSVGAGAYDHSIETPTHKNLPTTQS